MADLVIDPEDVIPGVGTTHLVPSTVAGEPIEAGQLVCLAEADQNYYLADANVTTRQNVKGIAGNTANAAGQRIDVISRTDSLEIGAHGLANGIALFASQTPGGICPQGDLGSGALPVLIGYVVSATAIQVRIAAADEPKP